MNALMLPSSTLAFTALLVPKRTRVLYILSLFRSHGTLRLIYLRTILRVELVLVQ